MLSVVPFDDRSQHHPTDCQLPDWLPKHEFLMLIIAPAGSGKTTLILNILMRIYPSYWQRMYIFSPTIHNDSKWQHLKECKTLLAASSFLKQQDKNKKTTCDLSGSDSEASGVFETTLSDKEDDHWKCNDTYMALKNLKDNEAIDPMSCRPHEASTKRRVFSYCQGLS